MPRVYTDTLRTWSASSLHTRGVHARAHRPRVSVGVCRALTRRGRATNDGRLPASDREKTICPVRALPHDRRATKRSSTNAQFKAHRTPAATRTACTKRRTTRLALAHGGGRGFDLFTTAARRRSHVGWAPNAACVPRATCALGFANLATRRRRSGYARGLALRSAYDRARNTRCHPRSRLTIVGCRAWCSAG